MERKLWNHQAVGVKRASAEDYFAFFFEQGCGKTLTIIKTLENKFQEHRGIMNTLILCPPVVVENWAREIAAFSQIPSRNVLPLQGPVAKRLKTMEKMGSRAAVAITNYEALYNKAFVDFLLNIWGPEVICLDESHYIKDSKAKRTRTVTKLCDKAKFVFLATGTPVLNSPMDIFSQWRAMDGGKTFGKNVFAFRAQYFEDKNAGMRGSPNYFPKWEPREGAHHRINFIIRSNSMRVTKDECLDLPPLLRQTRYIPLSPEQTKIYKDLKEDFISYLGENRHVVASMALTQALRLQQVVAGFVKADDGHVIRFKNHPRKQALKSELEPIVVGHKCIVWAVFKDDYQTIRDVCNELGVGFVEVHGETKDKQGNVDRFGQDDNIRVLIGHPRAGGIGINLTMASYAIFYSRNFSLGEDLQARARNHRGGSEVHKKITQIDFVAPGTVDEVVNEVLSEKIQCSEAILNRVKEVI